MPDDRSFASTEFDSDPAGHASSIPAGGQSGTFVTASSRLDAGRAMPRRGAASARPAEGVGAVGRIDLAGLTAVPPLHRPTVTGAAAAASGNHVGGAMSPPASDTVALSDGTKISFGEVEEVPVLEYA